MNIRHELNQIARRASTSRQVESFLHGTSARILEHRRALENPETKWTSGRRFTIEEMKQNRDDMIDRELNYYSTAYVSEVIDDVTGNTVWLLKYSDDVGGTGPFSSYEAAAEWFYKDGR